MVDIGDIPVHCSAHPKLHQPSSRRFCILGGSNWICFIRDIFACIGIYRTSKGRTNKYKNIDFSKPKREKTGNKSRKLVGCTRDKFLRIDGSYPKNLPRNDLTIYEQRLQKKGKESLQGSNAREGRLN